MSERRPKRIEMIRAATFAALFMFSAQVHASSDIGDSWSFEGLSDGDPIVDTNGASLHGMWEGGPFSPTNSAAEAVAISYTQPSGGYPLPLATHNIAMQILGDISNSFNFADDVNLDPTNVWIDLVAQLGQLTFEPDIPADAQLAAYVNTNGDLIVRHTLYTTGFAIGEQTWTTLQVQVSSNSFTAHTPIGTNDFVRLSVMINYITAVELAFAYGENYFQIYLDGVLLASPNGYDLQPDGSGDGPPTGGSWFLCSDSGYGGTGPNNDYLTSVAFSGAGVVDDIVVAESIAAFSTNTPMTAFEQWLTDNGIPPNEGTLDEDNDGASNWAEYVAGTDPDDDSDYFHIVRTEYFGTSNCIWWVIGTETNLATELFVQRATNLTDVNPWSVVASSLTPSGTGTNVWYDTAVPSNAPVYYQPGLSTNAP
ncbi:MAG: hypothetical protein OSB41_04155 [Kiritimatiellae bacterium]|nr:hypothetical protein [Kiritimatiellia bacterium]